MKTSPKTILHVFPSMEIGGAQRRFATLVNNDTDGYKHLAIALDGNYAIADHVQGLQCLVGIGADMPKGKTLAGAKVARKHLEKIKPDLMITYNWGSFDWVLANRFKPICPMIHIQDGFGTDEQAHEKWLRRVFRNFAYKGCDAVVVPSLTLHNIAVSSWKINKNRLHYIPNGIDLERFSPTAVSADITDYPINEGDKIIGTVAGMRPEKNIGRMIEAFYIASEQLGDTKLLIVGDGPAMPAMKILVDRTGLSHQVIFAGNSDAPESLMKHMDVFAMSSDTEQMPLAAIEAMATGLPIVSTDVGDIKSMVSEENQPFIDQIDADVLAENMCKLMADEPLREKIGAANKTKASELYSEQQMIRAYSELFESTVTN